MTEECTPMTSVVVRPLSSRPVGEWTGLGYLVDVYLQHDPHVPKYGRNRRSGVLKTWTSPTVRRYRFHLEGFIGGTLVRGPGPPVWPSVRDTVPLDWVTHGTWKDIFRVYLSPGESVPWDSGRLEPYTSRSEAPSCVEARSQFRSQDRNSAVVQARYKYEL